MLKRSFISATWVLVLILSATVAYAQRDQEVKVRLGETERASASAIRVNFVSVVEDSRCPPDAQCIWAGRVVIEVMIEADNGVAMTTQLSSDGEKKSVVIGDYRVHLRSVSTNPEHGSKTGKGKDEGYYAWFRFEKMPEPNAKRTKKKTHRPKGLVR